MQNLIIYLVLLVFFSVFILPVLTTGLQTVFVPVLFFMLFLFLASFIISKIKKLVLDD